MSDMDAWFSTWLLQHEKHCTVFGSHFQGHPMAIIADRHDKQVDVKQTGVQ